MTELTGQRIAVAMFHVPYEFDRLVSVNSSMENAKEACLNDDEQNKSAIYPGNTPIEWHTDENGDEISNERYAGTYSIEWVVID